MTFVARPSALHVYLYREDLKRSILSGRQFLALHVSAPAAACLAGLDLAAGGGFGESFSVSQFLQQTRILYFFLEFAHGFFHIAIHDDH